MGGKSTGTFSVDDSKHLGVFQGSVEIVSFLNAPGFIKAETAKGEYWPDASSCEGLQFTLKSSTPSYKGFRVSFGHKRPKGAFPYTYGFKTDLVLDGSTKDFQTVQLPFDQFTDKWDPGTGDAVVTCAENKEYCPEEADKKELYSIAVWGEGVEGKVDLEIQSVAAYGCKSGNRIGYYLNSTSEESGYEKADSVVESDTVVIEDFENPIHDWRTMNDPVMGGKSDSTVLVSNGLAIFRGICAIVPFLHAPGFITMTTGSHRSFFGWSKSRSPGFPDVSECQGLEVTLRTSVAYDGYYVSFGTDRAPGGRHAFGYKTHLDLEVSDDFVDLQLPFSDFSSKWDEATGKTTVTCEEDPNFCPSLNNLRDMKTISFWGEGVEGNIALDVKYIGAYGCASDDSIFTDDSLAAFASLEGGSYVSLPRSSLMLVASLWSALVAGLLYARRAKRRSSEYQQVDVVNEASLV